MSDLDPSTEPRRGHVPPLTLGQYRTLKRAQWGALDAACELARLGATDLAGEFRRGADMLQRRARELRVILDDAGIAA